MPKIPTYTQRTTTPTGRSGRQQAPQERQNFDVALPQDHVSGAMAGLGQEVSRYASQEMLFEKQMRQRAEKVRIGKEISKFQLAQTQKLNELKTSAQGR